MTTLTDKFDALETALAAQNATIAGYIDTVEDRLQSIADILDVLNENGASNTKYLLAAIGQSGACFPCPTPPMIVPPIGTTVGSINTDRCKRSQAIIAVIHALLANMDTMQSFNVIGTFNVVNGAISDYIGAIAAGDTVPLPSAPEAINIVGDYVSYAGERVFSGVGLVDQFSPLEAALTSAIFATTTPGAAQVQYNALIEVSGVSNGARLLFEAIAYTALWSYYFDPASTPDLSAYDGLTCGTSSGCYTIGSTSVTINGGGPRAAIVWETPFNGVASSGGTVSDHNIWGTDDLFNWTVQPTDTVIIYPDTGGGSYTVGPGDVLVLPHTTRLSITDPESYHPFSIDLCPPS